MGVVLRIGLCQVNFVVGDLEGNLERILERLREADAAGADLAAFPELAVSGKVEGSQSFLEIRSATVTPLGGRRTPGGGSHNAVT